MTRRTISLPDDLARRIESMARKEKRSFSATVAMLVDEALLRRRGFRSLGAGDSGLPDLGINHEKYLREIFKELRD